MRKLFLVYLTQSLCAFILLSASSNVIALSDCPAYPPAALSELQKLGAVLSRDKQMDYPRINFSDACYLEIWPKSTEDVVAIVKVAYQHHIPIRTQGGSHSSNGSSLPLQGDLLVHTNAMNKVTILSANEILAGSGVPVRSINFYLTQFGMMIPIENSGGRTGPTVGGFISAGGVSPDSSASGGFWDQVNAITIVTGAGTIMHVKKNDPLFLWIFGSMGQLGIITEAQLKIVAAPHHNTSVNKLPVGETISINFKANGGRYHAGNIAYKPELWLALFVAENQVKDAVEDLQALHQKYQGIFEYIGFKTKNMLRRIQGWAPEPYDYTVHYKINTRANPPLVYSGQDYFHLVSVFWYREDSENKILDFISMNNDLTKIALEKNYGIYSQVDLPGSPDFYKTYFPAATYEKFKQIKTKLDPLFLFNSGSFFPAKNSSD